MILLKDHTSTDLARALADLARQDVPDEVAAAYAGRKLRYGREYVIPVPFDPRLIAKISPAVAKAAMESGVATSPIADFDAYRNQLEQFVYHSGNFMKPIFTTAKRAPKKRIVYAEGEDERVLRATQVVVDEQIARRQDAEVRYIRAQLDLAQCFYESAQTREQIGRAHV